MIIGVVYGYFSLAPSWYCNPSQIINLKLIKFTWLQFNIQAFSLNNHTNPIPPTGPLCFLLRESTSKRDALLITEVGCMNADWHSLLLIPHTFSFWFPSRGSESLFLIVRVLHRNLGIYMLSNKNTAHLHCIVLADVIICDKLYGDRGIYAFRHSFLSFRPKW